MRWRSSSSAIVLATLLRITESQDSEVEVILTRGTSGLGVQLVSEIRGKGAVVESVVPGSAASLVLQPGDVWVSVAGIKVRRWSLENITRLLQTQSGRVKVEIQRRLAADSESQLYDDALHSVIGPRPADMTASCYARIEGDDEMHPIACIPANFGSGLPTFSPNEYGLALPVAIAQPLEYCALREGFNATGHALLVTRGGCLPHVKALNAARSGASVLLVVDGQFLPYPPLPKIVGKGFLTPLTSTHPSAQEVDISILIIHNNTGARILEEMHEGGRAVIIASHAGGPPSRLNVIPRNQLPLADVSRLNPTSDAFDLTSIFRDGDMHIGFGKPGRPRGEVGNIYLQVAYRLSTILTGLTQTISYTREVICPTCHGRGAHEADMRPCKSCSSLGEPGIASYGHEHSHEVKQTMRTTCTRCHGFGEVPKKGSTCPRCNGARVIHERASVEIDIPAGAPDPYTMKFPGVGSQFPGKATGSIEVVAKVEPDQSFTRYGADLRVDLNITLAEALTGFTRDFQLLNGSIILLNQTGITHHGDEIEIAGGGLPFWDPASAKSDRKQRHECTHGTQTSRATSDSSKLLSGGDVETPLRGSLWLTCHVLFPESLGEHSKGGSDARSSG